MILNQERKITAALAIVIIIAILLLLTQIFSVQMTESMMIKTMRIQMMQRIKTLMIAAYKENKEYYPKIDPENNRTPSNCIC